MKKGCLILVAMGMLWGVSYQHVEAACEVQTGTTTYANGTVLNMEICDANGARKTSGSTGVTTSTAILAGQVSVTATAQALPSNSVQSVCVKALAANSIKVYVGPSGVTTSNGLELSA